jgi:hypothetical protein
LKEKLEAEPDSLKTDARKEGLKLGVATLRAIAEKLNLACDELEK